MSELTAEQHELVSRFVDIGTSLNLEKGNSRIALIQAGLTVLTGLEDIARNQSSPWAQRLGKSFDSGICFLQIAAEIEPEIESDQNWLLAEDNPQDPNIDLFANAWTQYSESTFEHSVLLVGSRLKASGLDSTFFRGKTVFDGGCGTGRLSVFAARNGAEHVVSADIGGPSLEFLRDVVRQEGLSNVEVIEQDVTDLSAWADSSFDFVASNGVLHHTPNAASGIREHWKKTRPGGVFWVYLYGAGGIYWEIFDRLRDVFRRLSPAKIREILELMKVREGLIYTFLDNFLAPRVYFSRAQFLALLGSEKTFEWVHARGSSEIDDYEMWKKTSFGKEIYGPDGEIRLIVRKKLNCP